MQRYNNKCIILFGEGGGIAELRLFSKRKGISMYIICYYDNIKEIPTWEGVNGEDAMQNRVAELCESGVCPVEEISVFNEDDEIDNKKEETAQINAVSAEEAIIRWKKYIAYLKEWADDHSDPKFEGMSPAYYNEWMGNEYAEINEDFDD